MNREHINILLVDDDEDDFVITRDFLNEIEGYVFDVEWASSYEEGVQLFRRNAYDVMFFDYRLGAHTGVDLIKQTREEGSRTPVILLTGKGNRTADMEAMRQGAADYLIKSDIDAEKLERVIRYALERAASERALKTSEQKYRNIFERSRDMIYITDLDGNFIDFNDSATRIFGYSREELLKMNAKHLYDNPQDRLRFMDAINMTGIVSNYEVRLRHKTGERLYCLISGTIQRGERGEIQYQGLVHDITRWKKAEKDLIIAEKLAVTGRVVRTLAHEIRNPLTNINLSTEQIEAEAEDDSVQMYCDIIKRNAVRINDLITQLLHSARPADVVLQKHSLNDLVEQTLELAADRIQLKNIKVERDYTADSCLVNVDVEKMKTALLNVVINAVEAMKPDEGILKVHTVSREQQCEVIIEDNGVGISKDNIARLFEPYFTSKSNGMGLGLATAHNIIKSHNGSVDVGSEPGHGTRFTIHLNTEALAIEQN